MKLGFIGFGEVGFEMASGLRGEGLEGILAYDVMCDHPQFGALLAERVAKAGVTLVDVPEKMLQCVDVAIVAVPGDKALETAQGLKSKLTAGMLYVDVSASSPDVKKSISATIQDAGVTFVDGAMLGSLPLFQHKVPTLVSGTGSDRFLELMQPYHMKLEKVSDVPSEATAIKLIRSIFMKGLPALFVEVLEAASRMKVDHLVLKSLAATMNACPFEETFNRLVTGSAVHAARRAHEMINVVEMLNSLNIRPTMSQATFERLQWLAEKNIKEKFQGKTPAGWQQVVDAWQE